MSRDSTARSMSEVIFDFALKQANGGNHGAAETFKRCAFEESANENPRRSDLRPIDGVGLGDGIGS